MIVRISILDTIINLYKPRIPGNCIKFVSKLQFLTFCGGVKIKKELSLRDLALSLSCLGRGFVSIAHFRQEFDTHQAYFLLGVIIAQLLDCLVERV